MKKDILKTIWIIIAVFAINLSWGQSTNFKSPELEETERTRLIYKKKQVQAIEVISFEHIDSIHNDLSGKLIETRTLDTNGYLIYSKKPFGESREIVVYQNFDSLGNLLMFKQYINNKLFHESRMYYDEENTLISTVTVNASGKVDSVAQQKGRVEFKGSKKITTNAPGALAAKVIEEYNKKKGFYKSTTFGPNGKPIQIVEYDLNELGQIVSKRVLMGIGGWRSREVHKYNDNNLRTDTQMYNGDEILTMTIKREYDTNGLLIKKIVEKHIKNKFSVEVYRYILKK